MRGLPLHCVMGASSSAKSVSMKVPAACPMSWDVARAKFDQLTSRYTTPVRRNQIADTIAQLETRSVTDLMGHLGEVGLAHRAPKSVLKMRR